MCRRIDHYQFNRLMGGGLGDDAEGRSLEMAADRFRSAGLKNGYLQIAPDGRAQAMEAKARALGLKPLERVWVKFSRGDTPAPTPPTDLEIAEARPDEAMAFARAVIAGFGMPETLAPWLAAIVGREAGTPMWRATRARRSAVRRCSWPTAAPGWASAPSRPSHAGAAGKALCWRGASPMGSRRAPAGSRPRPANRCRASRIPAFPTFSAPALRSPTSAPTGR